MEHISRELLSYIIENEIEKLDLSNVEKSLGALALELLKKIQEAVSGYYYLTDTEIVKEIIFILQTHNITCNSIHSLG